MTIVQRDDLSQRTTLSKSALTTFDMCAQKTWQKKHYPRPWIPKPKMVFGSCVDAGVEVIVKCAASGQPIDLERAKAAALEVQARDEIEVDQDEVARALESFASDVLLAFDWHLAKTQAHIAARFPDWGDIDGHPDIILPRQVWDVKTSANPKTTARTLELGFYALIVEEDTGEQVAEVGYLNFVRGSAPCDCKEHEDVKGYWQGFGPDAPHQRALLKGPRKGELVDRGHDVPHTYVDDELRRWTRERVSAYVRADRADDLLNGARVARQLEPLNYSFPSGPVNAGICADCEYNPKLGGMCQMAPATVTEEGSDAA